MRPFTSQAACFAPNPRIPAKGFIRVAVSLLLGLTLLVTLLGGLAVPPVRAQTIPPSITLPAKDQALQGQVTITGTTGSANFASAELGFAYPSDTTNTWFVIQALPQPVQDGTLATWDTTQITDGNYVLRLRVFTTDGSFQDVTIPFEISNYTAPELSTATPAPTNPPSVQIPTPLVVAVSATPVPTLVATPTPLPANPAAMPPNLVYDGLGRGALFALAAFLVIGAILLRRRS